MPFQLCSTGIANLAKSVPNELKAQCQPVYCKVPCKAQLGLLTRLTCHPVTHVVWHMHGINNTQAQARKVLSQSSALWQCGFVPVCLPLRLCPVLTVCCRVDAIPLPQPMTRWCCCAHATVHRPHLSSRSSVWYSSGASGQKWSTKSGNGRLLGKPAQLIRTASSTPAQKRCSVILCSLCCLPAAHAL